jgi:site-specific DNA-methyltransferase (adenine-specific)
MSTWRVDHGDCLDLLRDTLACSVDAVVTDPPYGLSFMGKKWDYDVPSVEVWAECLRVLKPGGHLLAFAGTRTQHRMAVRIEDAGFEIRDMIAWVYGSGFPKSHNLDGDWNGWGTALKPALEPITMARKPFPGTVAANVMQHGTGAVNVDGCRVGTEDVLSFGSRQLGDGIKFGKCKPTTEGVQHTAGRWPANLIHDGSDEVLAGFPDANGSKPGSFQRVKTSKGLPGGGYGQERADMRAKTDLAKPGYEDSGSAARFFYCPKASKADREAGLEDMPSIHRPNGNKWTDQDYRVSSGERPPSAESGPRSNPHPTVKPTALMQYLCRLVTPPGGTVLDPFTGSGSTGKAAMLEGFNFIGFEREAGYVEIARRRIAEAANVLGGPVCVA